LNAEIVKALNTPEMRQRLADEGAEVEPSAPAELARFVHAEIAKWGRPWVGCQARLGSTD
jgi:tripartite-type tricarboxylate transporter receptor subunit TctC